MGNNSYTGIKQSILRNQQQILQIQMKQVEQVLQKYKISDQRQLQICSLTVTEIVQKLNKGQINSQILVAVLAYRSGTIGKKLNFYTLTNFSEALKSARQCDQIRQKDYLKNRLFQDIPQNQQKNYLPSLFGVPISLKDVYSLKGFATTLGLKAKAFNLQSQSPLVFCLKNSGAIPFIKSNVPQYCMSAETNNNLWGRSISIWNQKRAVGGSSGGEGGLISARCSILGVGSDIGGSIRLPAQHCGVFGLKPSSKRISNTYHSELSKVVTSMSQSIPLCIGPLAKSASDLALFMKVVTTQKYYQETHNPYTKIIQFKNDKYIGVVQNQRKFRIGYIRSLIDIQPSPTSARALAETRLLLQKLGHELIEIQIPNEKQLIRQYLLQISQGNAKYLREILAGQEPSTQNKMVIDILEMSSPTRMIAKYFARLAIPRAYYYSFSKQIKSILEYQTHIGEISELKSKFIKYWKQKQLDFAICPGFPCQAIPHGQSNKLGYVLAYTFIWNILDMVVGSLPVTVVRQDEQYYNSKHNDMFTAQLKKCAVGSAGLPAGVQIIGLPFKEQEVLGLMTLLEKQIKFYKQHPLPTV